MIVEDIIHGDIPKYTKLAFNSLKMTRNDSFSANQTGDDRLLIGMHICETIPLRAEISNNDQNLSRRNRSKHLACHLHSTDILTKPACGHVLRSSDRRSVIAHAWTGFWAGFFSRKCH